MKKLSLKRETIKTLQSDQLHAVMGGAQVTSGGASCLGGCNTRLVCVDTHIASNCNCGGNSFQCATVATCVGCPQYPF